MIRQFGASGGCIALYDENTGQMVIRLHMRVRSAASALASGKQAVEETAPFRQRVTIDLADPSSSGQGGIRRLSQPLEVDAVIALENSALFPIGMAYAFGQDLIGYTWRKNEPIIIRHDDYISSFQPVEQAPFPPDFVPSWYLSAPIQVPEFSYETHQKKPHSDVFAIENGGRNELLLDKPIVALPEDRPVWWRVTQEEKRTLLLTLAKQEHGNYGSYEELLKGAWGDQSKAETFLLLPMKMFTRVVGSLCLTSSRPDAYSPEEILVLETIVQIITVSIENAKLYDRSRQALLKAKQREESLAAMYSGLQAISTVLNVAELLRKFVETVANLVQAQMCTFFQLCSQAVELVAQAIYDATGKWKDAHRGENKDKHDDLIEMIRLPFKGAILERLVEAETYFYIDVNIVEELAQLSGEGGAIFLRETHIQKILIIPVRYQTALCCI